MLFNTSNAIQYSSQDFDEPLSERYWCIDDEQVQIYIGDLTCGDFIQDILQNDTIKEFLININESVHDVLDTFGSINILSNTIQDVSLYYTGKSIYEYSFYEGIIRKSLLDSSIIKYENIFIGDYYQFTDEHLCQGALQKAFTMIKVANSILAPGILKVQMNEGRLTSFDHSVYNHTSIRQESDLMPPNSFYVQAHIQKDCIDFILNKVVQTGLNDGITAKSTFTIQQRRIHIGSMVDSVSENVWDQLLTLEFETLLSRCQQHRYQEDLNISPYDCFIHNLNKFVNAWASIYPLQCT